MKPGTQGRAKAGEEGHPCLFDLKTRFDEPSRAAIC
jgi:hypothetical protein